MSKTICPICKKQLNLTLLRHVIIEAKKEAFKHMWNLYKYHKKDFKSVNRIVMLRQMPHFQHLRKNKIYD